MPDKLPPSVPTGSARAARTAGKKLEFARQYCSQCPVPIQLISRHARSLDATRKLQRIRTHKKRNRESPKWIAVSGPLPESTDCEARSARMAAVGAQRKHVTLPTDFRSPSQNGHSRYGHLTARFAPFRSLPRAIRKVSVGWNSAIRQMRKSTTRMRRKRPVLSPRVRG